MHDETGPNPNGQARAGEELRTLASFCGVENSAWIERVESELEPAEEPKSLLVWQTGFASEGMLVLTDRRLIWLGDSDAESGSVDLSMVKKVKLPRLNRFSFLTTTLTVELDSGHEKPFKIASSRIEQAKLFAKLVGEASRS